MSEYRIQVMSLYTVVMSVFTELKNDEQTTLWQMTEMRETHAADVTYIHNPVHLYYTANLLNSTQPIS